LAANRDARRGKLEDILARKSSFYKGNATMPKGIIVFVWNFEVTSPPTTKVTLRKYIHIF